MNKRKKIFSSITSRLLPAFFLVALIPTILLSFSTLYIVQKVAVANTDVRTSEQFSLIDAFIEDMVISTAMELSVISGHDSFGEFLKGEDVKSSVMADFEGAMVRHPEFLQLRYLDVSGMEKLRMNKIKSGIKWVSEDGLQDKSDYYYFRQALRMNPRAIYVSDLDLNVEFNKIEIPWRLVARIGIKVFHDNKLAGIMLVNIDGNYILSKILPFAGNRPDRAFLMNSQGKCIGFNGETFNVSEPEDLNKTLKTDSETIMNAVPKKLIKTKTGYISVMPIRFDSGDDGNVWRVVIFVSDDEIYAPLKNGYKMYSTALLLILGVAVVFAFFVSGRIITFVKRIVRFIPEASGEPFEQTGIREFDSIGEEIHKMAVGLKNTTTELENLNNTLEARIQENIKQISEMAKKQVAYEKQLRDIQSQLMHADRLASLGLISATVAHEIGNPLAAMKTSLQVLREDAHDDDERDFIGKIILQVDKLSTFLRSITRFGGAKQSEKKWVRMTSLLTEVHDFLHAEMRKNKVTFTVNEQADYELKCDETQIRQIIFNVMLNSIHELKDGGCITAEIYEESGCSVLHLYDTGGGVDNPDALFNPFFTTKSDGTGLGLAIVKDLVKQNGWQIKAENVPGSGLGIKIYFTGHEQ